MPAKTSGMDFRQSLPERDRDMTQHEWREMESSGEWRYNRASHHASRWTFQTTLASEPDWHKIDSPDRDFLEGLHDVLFRKYQRKRLPHKLLLDIEAMIEDLPPLAAEDQAPDEEDDRLP